MSDKMDEDRAVALAAKLARRRYYNTERPHSSLGYKSPAPQAIVMPATPRGPAPSSAQAIAGKPIMH
ncbi:MULTISPECIES: integrase core domain-containing protein [unclassified Aminobacter]|uniref:integrase core domain-containing protein n=1 Tax=unclassified Aminobacter TaxID=2644704 RepID=UPI002477E8D8|nr:MULTISPECIES: integrase core domain-containing protein [unclassified Aminobacter]